MKVDWFKKLSKEEKKQRYVVKAYPSKLSVKYKSNF